MLLNLLKDKRGFIDEEVLTSAGFIILSCMAIAATILGYTIGKKAGWVSFPFWQLILILLVEVAVAYFFASRD